MSSSNDIVGSSKHACGEGSLTHIVEGAGRREIIPGQQLLRVELAQEAIRLARLPPLVLQHNCQLEVNYRSIATQSEANCNLVRPTWLLQYSTR